MSQDALYRRSFKIRSASRRSWRIDTILQRLRVGSINDQIGVDREELYRLLGQVPAPVSGTGISRQERDLILDDRFDTVCGFEAAAILDVAPNLEDRGRLGARGRSAGSFRLGFQVCQVPIELVFGDALAPVEFIDAAANLGVNRVPVLEKPAVLFLLSFKQAEQHFFDGGGAGGLDLFLDSGFQGGVADFDVHGLKVTAKGLANQEMPLNVTRPGPTSGTRRLCQTFSRNASLRARRDLNSRGVKTV